MKTVRKRIEELERANRNGRVHFVRCENGVYFVNDDAGPLELNEKQYRAWLAENDNEFSVVFEVKRGSYENDKNTN